MNDSPVPQELRLATGREGSEFDPSDSGQVIPLRPPSLLVLEGGRGAHRDDDDPRPPGGEAA